MGMITSIRAPLPVAETPTPSRAEPRQKRISGAAAPVAAPTLAQAVLQAGPKSAARDPQFIAAQLNVGTSAAAAVEAARDAYIKASIAAGINRLPVP